MREMRRVMRALAFVACVVTYSSAIATYENTRVVAWDLEVRMHRRSAKAAAQLGSDA